MTGAERAQAAKAMAKANIADIIPPNATVPDVLDIIKLQFKKNQAIAYGKN